MLKFSEEHEWVLVEGDVATVGITDYAQKALGDVVFVELPEVGADIAKGDEAGVVESVKAASEIYSAISGSVTEINDELEADPSLVNNSPMDDGWFFKMTVADSAELDELMEQTAYDAFVAGLE
ncbi:MAG: glycine cleavage system protein GcvH [Rhodospirillaceae bacterium]|nr:glycine cleavage system protein GcvH [Rhodospirillaceae bacterium]